MASRAHIARADRAYLAERQARIVRWKAEELAATLNQFIAGHFDLEANGTASFAVELIAWDRAQQW